MWWTTAPGRAHRNGSVIRNLGLGTLIALSRDSLERVSKVRPYKPPVYSTLVVSWLQMKSLLSEDCPICLAVNDSETSVNLDACGHAFHRKCILKWYDKSKEVPSCPVCRTAMKVHTNTRHSFEHLLSIVSLFSSYLMLCVVSVFESSEGVYSASRVYHGLAVVFFSISIVSIVCIRGLRITETSIGSLFFAVVGLWMTVLCLTEFGLKKGDSSAPYLVVAIMCAALSVICILNVPKLVETLPVFTSTCSLGTPSRV